MLFAMQLALTSPMVANAVVLSQDHAVENDRLLRNQRQWQHLTSAQSAHTPLPERAVSEPGNAGKVAEPGDADDVMGKAERLLAQVSTGLHTPLSEQTNAEPSNAGTAKLSDVSNVLHPNDLPEIPRIIHHVYKKDISNGPWPNVVWKVSYKAWLRFYPSPWYKHVFWDDRAAMDFFAKHCPKQASVYQRAKEIVRADLVRYCILKNVGGIYGDLDYEPRANFYNDLDPTKVNLVQSPYRSETFQNSLMASRPGHPYWEEVLQQAVVKGQHSKDVLYQGGPDLLEGLNSTFNLSIVNPLPCNAFQRAVHLRNQEVEAASQKHCMKLSVDAVNDIRLKGVHWGTVSWMNGNNEYRKLFSAFHSFIGLD